MNEQSILSKADLFNLHSIQTTPIGNISNNVNRYERLNNGNVNCGARTMNCIGFDMDKNPEYFIPVMNGKYPIVKTKTNPRYICICGQKSTTICLTTHYESGNLLWVGTECINKNRDNIEKKIKDEGYKDPDLIRRLEYTQEAYDKYHRWDLDKDKLTCMGINCDEVLYKTNVSGHKKNWNGKENCIRCFKCEDYDKAKNCLCCNKKIFFKNIYHEDNTKEHLYKLDYCYDCGTNYVFHTFSSNINFSDVIYNDVVKKNKIVAFDDKWGVRGRLLKLPSNIRQNILGSKNYDSSEEDPDWENCEFYKYDVNDDLNQK
jgi:hypothetical protein